MSFPRTGPFLLPPPESSEPDSTSQTTGEPGEPSPYPAKMITTANVNARSGASTADGIIKVVEEGTEITVVGESENTARYAGINVSRVIMRTMAISGAICGLCGLLLVCGRDQTISTSTAGGNGFTAIIVAWLAKFNTFYMALIAFLLIFLQKGAGEIASAYGLNDFASSIISGVILFCILGSEFFVNYRCIFRAGKAAKKSDEQ